MRNELQKGTSAFGSKTLSQAFLLPCCVWTAHCCESCCYLRNSSSNKDAAVTTASLFSSSFPFPIPFFSSRISSLPFPQYFASTASSFSLPFFCLLGILRITSESPSLLKIHCQINIKEGRKIQLALCDLTLSATQGPGLPTSQGYEGLGDTQLLETPWWGQIPSSPSASMRWVGQERKNVKTKTSPCFFLPMFFLFWKNWHKNSTKKLSGHLEIIGQERKGKKRKEKKRKQSKFWQERREGKASMSLVLVPCAKTPAVHNFSSGRASMVQQQNKTCSN